MRWTKDWFNFRCGNRKDGLDELYERSRSSEERRSLSHVATNVIFPIRITDVTDAPEGGDVLSFRDCTGRIFSTLNFPDPTLCLDNARDLFIKVSAPQETTPTPQTAEPKAFKLEDLSPGEQIVFLLDSVYDYKSEIHLNGKNLSSTAHHTRSSQLLEELSKIYYSELARMETEESSLSTQIKAVQSHLSKLKNGN